MRYIQLIIHYPLFFLHNLAGKFCHAALVNCLAASLSPSAACARTLRGQAYVRDTEKAPGMCLKPLARNSILETESLHDLIDQRSDVLHRLADGVRLGHVHAGHSRQLQRFLGAAGLEHVQPALHSRLTL